MEEALTQMQRRSSGDMQQPPPNYEENPLEALRYENQKLSQRTEDMDRYLAQRAQAEQQQQAQMQFISKFHKSADAYKQENPEFQEAYQHLIKGRKAEYAAAGYEGEELTYMLLQEEAGIVAKAYNDGVNPAERLFNLAKARGYQSAPTKEVNNAADEKLKNIESGVNASRSLSNAGSKINDGKMTIEKLADIKDQKEFDAGWQQLFGKSI